ncbi:PspC domain-containing protein [Albibacterium bauzanense]|uniref:Phage shock protein C (PspC) family protein n=1 Tax=Albibacterium bauzanense TaxID=653929 RepID=A0A4R1M0S6_9SPHI|nr:PspC domain-containing protein [Albibacterium bauzanense]TCK85215.1 phage shock protein C (PspC) family protein [Albibacterium bauzanense]
MKGLVVFLEQRSFGVCTYLGERFGVSVARIRLFFIYSSFLAVGFPVIFYLLAGIVLDVRNYVKRTHNSLFDF